MSSKLSFLSLIAGLTCVHALALDTRATGGYVQNPSGSASFTMYTGCGAPGAHLRFLAPSSIILTLFGHSSLWEKRNGIYCSHQPASLRLCSRFGSRRCMWTLLRSHWYCRSIFAQFHWTIQIDCCEGDRLVVGRKQNLSIAWHLILPCFQSSFRQCGM